MAGNSVLRNGILAATSNGVVTGAVRRYGMRLGADRFVAGTTLDECIDALKDLKARGFLSYVSLLDEELTDPEDVDAAVAECMTILDRLAAENLESHLAIKLTQVGLEISQDLAYQNVEKIVTRAAEDGRMVPISMEESDTVEATLDIYRKLRESGHENVGTVLQAYLYRSERDLRALQEYQPHVRIVKGAYLEPAEVAYPRKADVDANYLRLAKRALSYAGYAQIATHDERIIDYVLEYTGRHNIPADRFEFQMLYGVRPDLQEGLVDLGLRVRLAVPYGRDWYPYFMRRLAERPANVMFLLKNLRH